MGADDHRPVTTLTVSRLVWYLGLLGVAFGIPELLAKDLTGVAPWFTFSKTVQTDAEHHPWFMLLAATVTVGVTVHWLFEQRLGPSLACAFSWALSAHLLNNRWP